MGPIRPLRWPLLALMIGLPACGITGSAPGPEQTSGFDVLTRADLDELSERSAFEAIRRLRPRWLRGRGPAIGADPGDSHARLVPGQERVQAYIDGVRQHEVQDLGQIRISDIETIRFLNASAATLRFGTDHPAGAIVVTTRTH